jgi:hypothetical protein
MLDRLATDAVRQGPEALSAAIRSLCADPENAQLREDPRDLLVALAPLHDAARRLGLDPVEVFDAAAKGAASDVAELAREFGRRTDVNGESFAYLVEETEHGLEYWHIPFGVDLRSIPREEREEALARRQEEFLRWVDETEAQGP